MSSHARFVRAALTVGFLLAAVVPVAADALRIIAADDRGVTLRLDVSAYSLSEVGTTGRSRVNCLDLDGSGEPGRPALPMAATLVALPPGATARVRIIEASDPEVRTGVRLEPLKRSVFRDDGGTMGPVPALETVEAIGGGAWPREAVELGEPYPYRGRRLVALRVRPFTYDEGAASLALRRSMTVRVDFIGGTPGTGTGGEDPHWDAVIEKAVINFEQSRPWRAGLRPATIRPEEMLRISRRDFRVTPAGPAAARARCRRPASTRTTPRFACASTPPASTAITFALLAAQGIPGGCRRRAQVSVHRHEFIAGATPSVRHGGAADRGRRPQRRTPCSTPGTVCWFGCRTGPSARARPFPSGHGATARRSSSPSSPAAPGLRVAQRPGFLDASVTPLVSHRYKQRFEKTGFYMTTYSLGNPPFLAVRDRHQHGTVPVDGLGVAPTATIRRSPTSSRSTSTISIRPAPWRMTIDWQGLKQNDHVMYADVRNGLGQYTTAIDSAYFKNRSHRTLRGNLPGTAFPRSAELQLHGTHPALPPCGREHDTPAAPSPREGARLRCPHPPRQARRERRFGHCGAPRGEECPQLWSRRAPGRPKPACLIFSPRVHVRSRSDRVHPRRRRHGRR